jgi:predicted ester cyclase
MANKRAGRQAPRLAHAATPPRAPGWLRAINRGDPATLATLCAPTLELHADDPFLPSLAPGRAGLDQWLVTLRTAFPDLKLTIDRAGGQGRTHVYSFTARGTHRGPLANVRPTGRPAAFVGRIMLRHDRDERIDGIWLRTHLASLVPQLGMGPTTLAATTTPAKKKTSPARAASPRPRKRDARR